MGFGEKWEERSLQSWLLCMKSLRRWSEEHSHHWQHPAAGAGPGLLPQVHVLLPTLGLWTPQQAEVLQSPTEGLCKLH